MASGESIAAWIDQDTKREIEHYADKHDYTISEAAGEMIEVGLRESTNPLVYRLKDRVVDWISLLGMAAVIVFLAGAATSVIHVIDAAKLSISLFGAALILLGVYELTRLALGMNRLGSAVRHVLGGTQR